MSNYISNNILTGGNMNISAITKGFVLPNFQFEIITPRRGGGGAYADVELYEQLLKAREQRDQERLSGNTEYDIEYINVIVDWGKNNDKVDKKIYAELIKKKITAQLITKFNESFKINVTLLDK